MLKIIYGKNYFLNQKIQSQFPGNTVKAVCLSLSTCCVFSLNLSLVLWLVHARHLTTGQADASDWLIIAFQAFLMLLIHDAYFYLTHRALHTKLFWKFHLVHHGFKEPNVWTSFAFHPIEALILDMVIYLFFFLSFSPASILIYLFLSTAINMYGHMGFEFLKSKTRAGLVFQIVNTTSDHDLHHSMLMGNFGLYTGVWDRLFNTGHKYKK